MLTREQFQTLYEQGPDAVFELLWNLDNTNLALQEQMLSLTARLKQLEDRLAKDSHNSNKPPSSDGLGKKPAPKSLRQKSGRKPGAQTGHPGRNLAFAEHPDQIMEHTPTQCACCGRDLKACEGDVDERRQVFDLPPLRLLVTEHRSLRKVCPDCGHPNAATFPEGVTQPVQYGARVKALGVYLSCYQLLPYERCAEAMSKAISVGCTFSPPTFISSDLRPRMRMYPPSLSTRSWVLNQPSASNGDGAFK